MKCPSPLCGITLVQTTGNVWTCPTCGLMVVTGHHTKEVREATAQIGKWPY